MKVTQMPPVHAANLAANSGNTAYGVDVIVNSSTPSATYKRQRIESALVQIMACRLYGAKPLSKPMLGYCQLDPKE